jgi:hypothetical protein
MPWLRVDDGLFLHPKWLATPSSARGLWITALSYCGNQSNGGIIPSALLPVLGGTEKDASDLVQSGLWIAIDGGWQIHNFVEYNDASTPQAKTARSEKRSEAGRRAGLASAAARQRLGNDASTIDQRFSTNGQRSSTNGQRSSTNGQRFSTPSPSPSPSPTYTDTLDVDNARAGARSQTLIERRRLKSMDSELDRPQPQRRMSETEARVARARATAEAAWAEENQRDKEAIERAFANNETSDLRRII